jgi:type I restriction enzyme R subunit
VIHVNRFSKKISEIIEAMRQKKIEDIQALKQAREIYEQVIAKEDCSIPEKLQEIKGADILYRNLQEDFPLRGMSSNTFCTVISDIFSILHAETIIDWHKQPDTQRKIKNKLDDYLYDTVKIEMGVDLSTEDITQMLDKIVHLALENYAIFS